MAITLEQQRAADAWKATAGKDDKYTKLAKGLPSLIMQSGLMQTLAFLHEKGADKKSGRPNPNDHHTQLGDELRSWLQTRFPQQIKSAEFGAFMQTMMQAEPRFYQQVTTEAYDWLRWVRQIAPARNIGARDIGAK